MKKTKLQERHIIHVRRQSGGVESSDGLVSFLYELMRDELPPGKVENIVQRVCAEPAIVFYTNGWLAKYAKDLALRIRRGLSGDKP